MLARCHEVAASSGRFHTFMNEPVQNVQTSPQSGAVTGICTAARRWVTSIHPGLRLLSLPIVCAFSTHVVLPSLLGWCNVQTAHAQVPSTMRNQLMPPACRMTLLGGLDGQRMLYTTKCALLKLQYSAFVGCMTLVTFIRLQAVCGQQGAMKGHGSAQCSMYAG